MTNLDAIAILIYRALRWLDPGRWWRAIKRRWTYGA